MTKEKTTKKRTSPTDKDKKRFYHSFTALYGHNITTYEDFQKAYDEYTFGNSEEFREEMHDDLQDRYFNSPQVKNKLMIPKEQHVTTEMIPRTGHPKVEKHPFAKQLKERNKKLPPSAYNVLSKQKGKSVYGAETKMQRMGRTVTVYRDKNGRFVKKV